MTDFTLDPKIQAFAEEAYNTPIVKQVQKKYFWIGAKKPETHMNDVFTRVAHAIANAPCETNPGAANEAFYKLMEARLWLPGGRILAGAGTDKRVTLMNCFSRNEKFITAEYGLISFEEAVKLERFSVLNKDGKWAEATAQSFGTQVLNEVTFSPRGWRGGRSEFRKVVEVTPDHRWILQYGNETTNLRVGDKVRSITVDSPEDSGYAAGWIHGFVYGDGHNQRSTLDGNIHFTVRLCGQKKDFLPKFESYPGFKKVYYPEAAKGEPVVHIKNVQDLKKMPEAGVSPQYMRGFIEGYDRADGDNNYRNGNSLQIFSKKLEDLEYLAEYAPLGGYTCVGLKQFSKGITNYGGKTPLYVIRLSKADITWEVVDIQPKDAEPEEVFCCIVPEGKAFVLSHGILTHNCYVNQTLHDSMEGIVAGLSDLHLTMQQGGGVGTAFETLRPAGAALRQTQSHASGILPFMDEFNSASNTIKSAGERSGAMMGTISDTHPDLPKYIRAKAEGSYFIDESGNRIQLPYHLQRWNTFNVSILVSDALMSAVEEDQDWLLYFHIDTWKKREQELIDLDFTDEEGKQQYVYAKWRARDLWDLITEYTYQYSDPGVIFIDRINDRNNLSYVETIRCTNPCGEQPLPPNGTCNLGAINVSQCVLDPFTPDARVNWDLIAEVAKWGVRFLDNVIEVTGYPLEAQRVEEYSKRRIGLGILGLGTMFAELGVAYGSLRSVQLAEKVMKTIALSAYEASIFLAKERGSFPLFDADKILNQPEAFVCSTIPLDTQMMIQEIGLRNGVILTIAPVGTGSIAIGNPSSGLEPDFAHSYSRNVRVGNSDEWEAYTEESYTYRFFKFCTGETQIPAYMNTAMDISVEDHIQVQAALQKWIDASVSKTINVPTDIPREQFNNVYKLAYDSGCKGCTTYRPTENRMSILSIGQPSKQDIAATVYAPQIPDRGEALRGTTYKIKWPSMSASVYVTINYLEGKPYEIFFATKDAKYQEWMTGLTLMISAIMRQGVDPSFIPGELRQVISTHDTAYHNKKFVGSLVARIGQVIEADFIENGIIKKDEVNLVTRFSDTAGENKGNNKSSTDYPVLRGSTCPSCGQPSLQHIEGCKKCTNCTYSAC